jgi:hypothetical protein
MVGDRSLTGDPGAPCQARGQWTGHLRRDARLPRRSLVRGNTLDRARRAGGSWSRSTARRLSPTSIRRGGWPASPRASSPWLLAGPPLQPLAPGATRRPLLREQIKQERAIFNLKGYAEKIVASVPSGLSCSPRISACSPPTAPSSSLSSSAETTPMGLRTRRSRPRRGPRPPRARGDANWPRRRAICPSTSTCPTVTRRGRCG